MKIIKLTFILLILFINNINSQTFTFDSVSVNPLEICIGDCVDLYADGNIFTGNAQTILNNNFNDTVIGAGWYSQNQVMFDNPCNTAGDNWNGTTYMWFGDSTTYSRDLYSPAVSISDSSTICFDIVFATQGVGSPCEGPDEMDEGVSLQYTIENDSNWYDITYFCPDGNQYPSNLWIGQSTSGGGNGTPFNEWNTYCFNIPTNAYSDSTQFRWHQDLATDTTNDHWGLDNILIYTGTLSTYINWYDENNNVIYSDIGLFQQCPTENTTYLAEISNGVFSSSSVFDVFVNNLQSNVSLSNVNIYPDTINMGDTVFLYGLLNDTITYTNSEDFLIPDGSGQDTTSLLFINTIGVINDVDNIGICMDIEHSYAGDLQINIICPNGQEMMLFDGYGNSDIGGEYLGEPTDQTSNPGNPYTYCLNNSAINGTMEDVGVSPPTYSYVDNDTNTVTNHEYIPGGIYESSGNWDSLIGCPYNGIWTLQIIDNMGSDDGYIFNWDISFNNLQLNTLWQGENTFYQTNDSAFAIPTTIGLHPYTYTVENEFGCTYDTTIYVYVDNATEVNILENNTIKIYPNPATTELTIESTATIETIEILDITGKTIFKPSLRGGMTKQYVNISKLEKGIYFIKINDKNLLKFVKE